MTQNSVPKVFQHHHSFFFLPKVIAEKINETKLTAMNRNMRISSLSESNVKVCMDDRMNDGN